jgi:hypothetical protein
MEAIGSTPVEIGSLFKGKTIDPLRVQRPTYADQGDIANHSRYNVNGRTTQAATFAMTRLSAPSRQAASRAAPLQIMLTHRYSTRGRAKRRGSRSARVTPGSR